MRANSGQDELVAYDPPPVPFRVRKEFGIVDLEYDMDCMGQLLPIRIRTDEGIGKMVCRLMEMYAELKGHYDGLVKDHQKLQIDFTLLARTAEDKDKSIEQYRLARKKGA